MLSRLRRFPWPHGCAAPAVAGPAISCGTRPSRISAPGPAAPTADEARA